MTLINRTTQLRMRRMFRRRQKQVEAAAVAAEKSLDTNLIGRFDKFLRVKRFAFGWLILVLLITFCTIMQTIGLSSHYQQVQPYRGGIYNEGIVGTYSNANPLFAAGSVDVAVSRLIFSGLLKYDNHNQLTGDLAESYTVDQSGKQYVVKLKPNLTWQDGAPLTAEDVAFTYKLIQNPDVGSPLLPSWQGITITANNDRTVTFDLPSVFAPFAYNLVTGIVPEHILDKVPAAQLRSDAFNTTQPVGAGPFAWQAFENSTNTDPDKLVSLVALKPFDHYAHGKPKLDGFVLHTFGSKGQMIEAFQKRDINAMTGLDRVPTQFAKSKDVTATSFNSTAAVMSFFRTSSGVLADTQVRQAMVQGADTVGVLQQLGYPTRPVNEPLLATQLGYDPKFKQASYNPTVANELLDKAGWTRGSNGKRSKAGQPLAFRLYAEDTPENSRTARLLAKDWAALGADVTPVLQQLTDFQTTLEFHTYDALLYGISIGVDPDVYAYWDSSQADIRSNSRLNFSEYKSAVADAALESGRTRLDPALRVIKYKPFLQAWQADAPALGLYQPRFLYITRGTVYGLDDHTINTDADRYDSVANWQIHTTRVTN
jgi:peptide/nickel transport system substrate-binding protein